jgi:hypothetical protein
MPHFNNTPRKKSKEITMDVHVAHSKIPDLLSADNVCGDNSE